MEWNIQSWQKFIDSQQVNFDNLEVKSFYKKKLSMLPKIVDFDEIENLNLKLNILKNNKNNFTIHLGECNETFENFSFEYVNNYNKLFADIKTKLPKKNVIKIARLAGQFAKPRSKLFEIQNSQQINAYRGDLINQIASDKRKPNLKRWFEAYAQASITKSLLNNDIFISHESLLLEYEENFIRNNQNNFYSSSAHILWVGQRTTFLNSAHIEFVRGIMNPVAFKVNHKNIAEISEIISMRGEGKKNIIIGRFGLDDIEKGLNTLVEILKKNSDVIFFCDPMHGNNRSVGMQKYRLIAEIKKELSITTSYLKLHDLKLDGVMLESTAEDVLECVEDVSKIQPQKYKSSVDPRLNYQQTIEIIDYLNQII